MDEQSEEAVKAEFLDHDDESLEIKEEPPTFEYYVVEEGLQPDTEEQDEHSIEDNSTQGESEDVASTSGSNKRKRIGELISPEDAQSSSAGRRQHSNNLQTKESRKRQRSENWIASDRILLRHLIRRKISIIENKSVDTSTSVAKRIAWKKICDAFNQCCSVKRSVEQIRGQWRSLKCAKKVKRPQKLQEPPNVKLLALISEESEMDHNEFVMPNSLDESKDIERGENLGKFQNGIGLSTSFSSPADLAHRKEVKPISTRMELFEMDKQFRQKQMEFLMEEHCKKMKILVMEHQQKEQAFENNERRAEVEHVLRLQLLQQQNQT